MDFYHPVRTSKPNEMWCADVTIFKTTDNVKHCIHLLIDHYSKMILGFRIEKNASGQAIKSLIQEACFIHQPDKLLFLTDGGSENVNSTVTNFINSADKHIKHIVAQRDVVFSNSMIEATNKIIKHQFLFPLVIENKGQLLKVLKATKLTYNTIRPQMSLRGNTPQETYNGLTIDFYTYNKGFKEQKTLRIFQNKKSTCAGCL